MSRVKEYLALIPIVGTKYVYQRGVNGSSKVSLKISKLPKPSSGANEKQTTTSCEVRFEGLVGVALKVNMGDRDNRRCSMATRYLFDQFVLLHKDYVWLEGL